jgi:hypothetical protein
MAEHNPATQPEAGWPAPSACERCLRADLRRALRSTRWQRRRTQLARLNHRLRHATHPGSRARLATSRSARTIIAWIIQAIILAIVALIISHYLHF